MNKRSAETSSEINLPTAAAAAVAAAAADCKVCLTKQKGEIEALRETNCKICDTLRVCRERVKDEGNEGETKGARRRVLADVGQRSIGAELESPGGVEER